MDTESSICLMPQCGYLSETSRMIEIYRALRARGVTPRVATHGGRYEDLLRAAGIDYDLLGPPMSAQRSLDWVQSTVGLGDARQSAYTDEELRAYVRAEAAYLRTHGIRVAVTGFLLSVMLSSRLAGATVVTDHGCWVPPVWERGLVPAPASPPWPALRALPEPVVRRLANRLLPRTRAYCGGFNRVARDLGIPGVPSLAALVLGDLALITEIPQVLGVPPAEVEAWSPRGRRMYRPDTRLAYAGPIYAHLDAPLPEHAEALLHEPGPPVVYVAPTSTRSHVVRAMVATLRTLDVRLLVAGTVHDVGDLAEPGRVVVGGVLPSHLIMPRVALAVTAGGQGSVQTAMAAGTPLIGMALHPEQDLNVALVERLGAARRIGRAAAGTPALARIAGEMLADDGYRRAAGTVAGWYAAADGPGAAADAILAHAAAGVSPAEPR